MNGRRVELDKQGIIAFQPGDYGKDSRGVWMCRTPEPTGFLGDLKQHDVVEHEDGTITVSPSILVADGQKQWHGYLERGVWREC